MEKNRLLAFLGLSLLIAFILELFLNQIIDWAVIIGKGIGLFLFTLMITYLLKGIAYLFKSNFDSMRFYNVYLTLWIVFLIPTVVASFKEADEVIVDNVSDSNQPFIYSPVNCIYEVTFQEKPNLKQASVEHESGFLNGEVGELILKKDKSLQKIEFYQPIWRKSFRLVSFLFQVFRLVHIFKI